MISALFRGAEAFSMRSDCIVRGIIVGYLRYIVRRVIYVQLVLHIPPVKSYQKEEKAPHS